MKIYIWLNEEVTKKLEELGLNYAKDVLGGMKRIEIEVEENTVNEIVKLFPNVKVDTSTTKSIELLPKHFKNEILKVIIEKRKDPKEALLDALQTFKRLR
ncbi:DUF6955 family protein [Acidianus manzaensis]|uniref:Uncharacterized protein n=1 Tax=Acidianus manzaensis TaxID=282676 RepID=A0A1W6JZ23_9CREN|nr:hypothetical protein [Acidianus manzaensis]ARM75508.1 hypothetical protein B6F84_05325 [Acidianus manzaensis]